LQLVVDASALVGEVLRARGKWLLEHAGLDLVMATAAAQEALHEIPRRILAASAQRDLTRDETAALLRAAVRLVRLSVSVAAPRRYAERLSEAAARLPRDAADAPTLALALAHGCGIWTADRDFFGCGMPVWSTDTLLWYMRIMEDQ
jgi:predicted nucleic acid-binding protein